MSLNAFSVAVNNCVQDMKPFCSTKKPTNKNPMAEYFCYFSASSLSEIVIRRPRWLGSIEYFYPGRTRRTHDTLLSVFLEKERLGNFMCIKIWFCEPVYATFCHHRRFTPVNQSKPLPK